MWPIPKTMTSRGSSIGNCEQKGKNCGPRGARRFVWVLLVLGSCLMFPSAAYSQSKKELESDKAKVEQEIKRLNNDLAKAKKNSKAGQQQLRLLEKKIAERTRLINNLDGQLNLLNIRMTQTEDSIALIRGEVDSMKVEYGKVVRALYRERHNVSHLSLVLDTKSYNYAYLRTKYFRDDSRYRRRQAMVIRQKEQELSDAGMELKRQQREQQGLLEQHRRQKAELAHEQQVQQKSLKNSKQQEKALQ